MSRNKCPSVVHTTPYHRIPPGQCQARADVRGHLCLDRACFGAITLLDLVCGLKSAMVWESFSEPARSKPGSYACHPLLHVLLLPRCSRPLLRYCRRPLRQCRTHHHASGAMVRRCGPLATKHVAPVVAMSLRDTMAPVRDTGMLLLLDPLTLTSSAYGQISWTGMARSGKSGVVSVLPSPYDTEVG
jgi:hypothetical protein